jgi:hypothetical protein
MNTLNLERDTVRTPSGVRWHAKFHRRPVPAKEKAKASHTLKEINDLLAASRTERVIAAEANCVRLTKKTRL